jgi:hypothetical protein
MKLEGAFDAQLAPRLRLATPGHLIKNQRRPSDWQSIKLA